METIRRIIDIAPDDIPIVERMFGTHVPISAGAELVLRIPEECEINGDAPLDELPDWCNVLEGMSDADRDEFRAILKTPVRLSQAQ
jgi:hypothetical protein